jgi:hypothetical protein
MITDDGRGSIGWRSLAGTIVCIALCVGPAACGGGGAKAHAASTTSAHPNVSVSTAAARVPPNSGALRGLRGDEDDDDTGEGQTTNANPNDNDADFDNDSPALVPKGYYDADDGWVLAFGSPPTRNDERALAAIVERYYGAAARADGSAACALMTKLLVLVVLEDYGQAPGPRYARGKTCPGVTRALFRHEHAALFAERIRVVAARTRDGEAYVLVGSHTAPATYMTLKREDGGWQIAALLGSSLR